MAFFNYETHMHTSQGSACGLAAGGKMAEYYKSLGYTGFIVTDHFFGGNTAVSENQPWPDAVEQFCSGYEDAKKRGGEIGFDVFFGFEYCFRGTEFLVYGLDKEWLLHNPQIIEPEIKRNLKKALHIFKESGAVIIHAHPFREAPYIDMLRFLPEYTDAVEIFNPRNTKEQNMKAGVYAKMYGFTEVSGGDAHSVNAEAAGIRTKRRAGSFEELLGFIRARAFCPVKNM